MSAQPHRGVSGQDEQPTGPSRASLLGVFRLHDFRLLVAGEGVSLLGDQFLLIALPWLVLAVTRNLIVLGAVLAIQNVPRALFMLVGGAVTDRFSPRGVMMAANAARLVTVAALAAIVLLGTVHVWTLFVFAVVFGLGDGFFYPAQNAIVPQIAGGERLETANAVVLGLEQVAQFLAPALAGVLIAGLAGAGHDLTGVGVALAIDAGTFLVSLLTLQLLRVRRFVPEDQAGADGGVVASIRAGLRYMWDDPTLRMLFTIIVAVNFLIVGPMLVGIPVLAARRLSEGAAGYGIIMSTFGGSSLLGIAAGGLLPRPPARLMGSVLLGLCAVFSVAMALLGFSGTLFQMAAPVFAMGAASGYLVVFFFSWLQGRTPAAMMGRMMSLVLFASVGLVPVSEALCGVLMRASVTALFVGAGLLLAALLVRAALTPSLRAMGVQMAADRRA
ncbi:MAG TPA: MFS transporter [Thermoleophilia bacterium]|nr:MFS transporter [Thermoleophilia bacterium]